MSSKVSFTIRRPTASSGPSPRSTRPLNVSSSRRTSYTPHDIDSSDEEDQEDATELVTGFDRSGVQRLHDKPKPSGPLVIPPLADRDWRAVARIRKQQQFIPDGAAAQTGKDGSQGGLGTRDSINSGPQAAGLIMRRVKSEADLEQDVVKIEAGEQVDQAAKQIEETEDERARRALLGGAVRDGDEDRMTIDAIPLGGNDFTRALMDETDAYKQDVVTRPDSATLADYERVPVSQFGAALLRGMGWKEGTAASRTRRGMVEPWLPSARPALLGIGAKERPADDIPATGKGGKVNNRPERRYVPLVKIERESSQHPPPSRSRSRSPDRSRASSRFPSSKSASPYPADMDGRHRYGERGRAYDDYEKSRRDINRDRGDYGRQEARGHRKERGDRHRDTDRSRERDDRSRSEYRRDGRDSYVRGRGSRD